MSRTSTDTAVVHLYQIDQTMLALDALRSLKSDTEARRPAKLLLLLLLLLSASLLGMCGIVGSANDVDGPKSYAAFT